MDVKRSASMILLLLLGVSGAAGAAETSPGEVRLPLKDYLALVDTAERTERLRAEELAHREAPVAEVVSQRVAVTVGLDPLSREAAIASDFEVLLRGRSLPPVPLPVAGFPGTIEIRDEAGRAGTAAVAAVEGGIELTAPQPGRYTIHVASRAALGSEGGTGSLALGRVAAAVASTEIDLPADLAWSSPGAVVVEEKESNGRRRVRLATARGADTVLDIRRKVDSAEADKLLAESVVLTILQLRPEGLKRHDVVLYEVRRGGLGRFSVALPPGLEIDQAGTDEGTVVPVVETGRLTVHRQHQLQGVGYLVLTSIPSSLPAQGLSLDAVKPDFPVRARYLAVSLAVAAEVRPLPAASWTRVDTSDLPAVLSEALAALDLAAAWRLSAPPADTAGARLAVAPVPAAPLLDAVIRRRDTTTLLTVDGTLLYRDHFVVDTRSRSGAALDMVLPAGAKLWSARVDEQPVRPLERAGTVSVPLGFTGDLRAEVEVVSVLEKALPPGRSQLALDLPQVTAPVLLHHLRLLLPERTRYRLGRADLRFVPAVRQASLKASNLRINVGGNESGQQSAYIGPGSSGNLYVTVVSREGAPLPGATLTLRGTKGGTIQTSDATGKAAFKALAAGDYTLSAELEGFSTLQYPKIVLTGGRNTVVEVTLEAAVEDVITVLSESPLLDERRISTGATISNKELEKIPAARDPWAVLQDLQKGLVKGVKPLPVSIPETGKAFVFAGVLPPAHIRLELDVKAER